MKQLVIALFIVGLFAVLCPAEEIRGLASEKEKDSYSLGYQFGNNMKKQPVDLDLEVIITGIRDAYDGKGPKLSAEEMKEVLGNMKKKVWVAQQREYQEKASRNLKEGEAFLAENSKKGGVTTLPSGLQYKVLREGEGPSPKATDRVTVHYRGSLIDGTEFDSSYPRREPSTVHVIGMIEGWTEALQLMKTASKWQIFIPAKLAYGERQFNRIPPNSTLIFEIELLSVSAGPGPATTGPEPATAAPPSEPSGNKTASKEQVASSIAPPQDLRVFNVKGGFKLTWKPSADDPGRVTGYEILRARNISTGIESGPFSIIGTVKNGVLEYIDTTAPAEYIYYYKVRAVAGAEQSPESNTVRRGW